MNLYRLVYTSFRKCDDKGVSKILESCKRNNAKKAITGILLHSNRRFIQYLEGDRDEILSLYERIKSDPRHTSVLRRNFELIKERVFPSWEMGYKDISDEKLKFNTEAKNEDYKKFEKLLEGEINLDDEGLRVLQLFFKI